MVSDPSVLFDSNINCMDRVYALFLVVFIIILPFHVYFTGCLGYCELSSFGIFHLISAIWSHMVTEPMYQLTVSIFHHIWSLMSFHLALFH